MKHICEKCGAELDKNTGLCPNCDGDEFVPMANLEEIEEKKVTKRGIIAIFVAIISILVVVSVAIVAVLNGWIGGSEKRTAALDSYKTYFNETLYSNYGIMDTEHPYVTGTGMFFADIADLSGDKNDDMIIGMAIKSGDKIEYNISCYEYNPNTAIKRAGSTDETSVGVELDTTVDVFDENDFVEYPTQHKGNKFQFYSVEHKDKNYIFFERVSGKKWYCRVYSINKGTFAQTDSIDVKNYDKSKSDVDKFFKKYGIKDAAITDNDKNFTLTKQDKKDLIFTYSFTQHEDKDDEYSLKDYTDMDSLLNSKNKAEVKSKSEKNEKAEKKKSTSQNDVIFGDVISSGNYVYYWKYNDNSFSSESSDDGDYSYRSSADNQLIRRNKNGEETVLAETAGAGKLAIAGGRIFFQKVNSSSRRYNIDSCDLSGNDITYHDTGVLEGVVQNGDYIIYSPEETDYEFGTIKAIRVEDLEKVTTVYNARFLACDSQRVYYQSEQAEYSEAHHGKTTLSSVYANGSGNRTLFVTDNDLYSSDSSGENTVSLIRNPYILDGYIYYSYGSYARNNDEFKGGNIARVKLDGTQGKILGKTSSPEFAVNSSGKIVKGENLSGYIYKDGAVYKFNPENEKEEEIISADDYSEFTSVKVSASGTGEEFSTIGYAVKISDKLYFTVTSGTKTDDGYRFDGCALFEKDSKTSSVQLIYSTLDSDENDSSGSDDELITEENE